MLLFAQTADAPSIQFTLRPLLEDHGIPLAIMGVLVVFGTLVLVSGFISLLPRLAGSPSQPEKHTAPAAAKRRETGDELSEEMVVVIAAAVAEVMAKPHRILHIRGMTPEDAGWSFQGRMQHHSSHRIQRRDRR